MPRGDRTGPMGAGAMTGRGVGYCSGSGVPGYANPIQGHGLGIGYGRGRGGMGRGSGGGGRGRRNMFYATGLPGWMRCSGHAMPNRDSEMFQNLDPRVEQRMLKEQADSLQSELEVIKKRLSEIETEVAAK